MANVKKRIQNTAKELTKIGDILNDFEIMANAAKSKRTVNTAPALTRVELKMVGNLAGDINQIRGKVRGYLLELQTAHRKISKDIAREISHEGADVYVAIPGVAGAFGKRKFYQLKSCAAKTKGKVTDVLRDAIIQVLGVNKELVSAGGELICEVVVRSSKCYWPYDSSDYKAGSPAPAALGAKARAQIQKAIGDALTTARSNYTKRVGRDPQGNDVTLSQHFIRNFGDRGNNLKIVIRFDKGMVVNPNVTNKEASDYYMPRAQNRSLTYLGFTSKASCQFREFKSRRSGRKYRRFAGISIKTPSFKKSISTNVPTPAPSNPKKRGRS